ncbi:caspase family protein [Sodalinema gerasimenkoae]|uniref:caspase family protein n=1 Tax=Sodalinema gerasimenkoae TaxID=2862348 RepID=UPI00135835D9|nr:caspase family protein [Sodalinema gerasimenkoae]
MSKIALLIGVSHYKPGLTALPGAVRDVEAMQQVLEHPNIGGFDDVVCLVNPDRQQMEQQIEALFSNLKKDDVVLLFFSGHGIKDEIGALYFATSITQKKADGQILKSTAVSAGFIQDMMAESRSKRQVVILDCCFSGAFAEGMTAKDDGGVDVQAQLGGEGRAVLTSSTSLQYSFEQDGESLSLYTRYLVEGLETGAADSNRDGIISVYELHCYTKAKVSEAAPAMRPKIFAVEEGFQITIGNAPLGNPELQYRQEVSHLVYHGEISTIARLTLDTLRHQLELPETVAHQIEAEVLEPHRHYQKRLSQYESVLKESISKEFPISEVTEKELNRLQQILSLKPEDVRNMRQRLTPGLIPKSSHEIPTNPQPTARKKRPASQSRWLGFGLIGLASLGIAIGLANRPPLDPFQPDPILSEKPLPEAQGWIRIGAIADPPPDEISGSQLLEQGPATPITIEPPVVPEVGSTVTLISSANLRSNVPQEPYTLSGVINFLRENQSLVVLDRWLGRDPDVPGRQQVWIQIGYPSDESRDSMTTYAFVLP